MRWKALSPPKRAIRVGGLIVWPDPFNATNRDLIIALAAHYGVPAIYNSSYYAQGRR